jgi:signal transduction histidine kinase
LVVEPDKPRRVAGALLVLLLEAAALVPWSDCFAALSRSSKWVLTTRARECAGTWARGKFLVVGPTSSTSEVLESSGARLTSARPVTGRRFVLSAGPVRYGAGVVGVAVVYYACAVGGKALLLTGPAGAFWPAAGLAVAVLYLGGLRWWPGVLLGDLGSLVGDVVSLAVPPGTALAEAVGDMAGIMVAVVILRRLVGARAAMDRLQHVGAVLVAVATGAAISAVVAMVAVWAGELIDASEMSVFWRSWWLGDVAGGLVVIPLALAWARRPGPAWRGRRAREGALVIAAVVSLSVIAVSSEQPLTYLVFPALIWAALRLGPRGATLAVAVAVVIAVWAASNELGPFVEHSPTASALNLQLYIAVAALTTLCLAAIVSERQRVARELAETHARIASAGADERRRLGRELHDSAQNPLVALRIRLGLAEERAAQTSPELVATLAGLGEDAVAINEQLRRIALGISPPLLAERGIIEALRAATAHGPIPVSITASGVGPGEPRVEIAVYLCCLELIQNAAKHAGPGAAVTVRLEREADELAFTVHDTGRGFDQRAVPPGTGLSGVRERISSVGGHIEITASPSRGTTATGVVPWPPRAF